MKNKQQNLGGIQNSEQESDQPVEASFNQQPNRQSLQKNRQPNRQTQSKQQL